MSFIKGKINLKISLQFFLYFTTNLIFSQQNIYGIVYDEGSNPLPYVHIKLSSNDRWTTTNDKGEFKFSTPNSSQFSLVFSYVGRVTKEIQYNQNELTLPIKVTLKSNTLRLDEVEISAKPQKFSEITFKEEAIAQVQAFSIDEVLEQLPGQSVSPLNLNGFKNIVFRTANVDKDVENSGNQAFGNKAFGTAFIIDDIPISNNENLQTYAPNVTPVFGVRTFGFLVNDNSTTNANFGVDLREIPITTIESIEVVQGIPSVKYGDLTSGAVKIETKAGKTPYRVSTSLRDGTTQFDFSKGLLLNKKFGYINLSFNYLHSNADPRNTVNQFKRYNIGSTWSITNSSKTISNSLRFGFSFKKDDGKIDPDDAFEKKVSNEAKGITISNNFKWQTNKRWIDKASINSSFSYNHQFSHQSRIINGAVRVVPVNDSQGISEPAFTPFHRRQVSEIDGRPISAFLDISLHKSFSLKNNWQHKFLFGSSIRLSDNLGKGRLTDSNSTDIRFGISTSGYGQGTDFRPSDFDDVHAETQYGFYLQDNITKKWNRNKLNVVAGVRYDLQNEIPTFSPRINSSLTIGRFKLRGGIGFTSKAPSLNMLNTGPHYYDRLLDLTPDDTKITIVEQMQNNQLFALLYTNVTPNNNTNLKPSKSIRSETGFDYRFGFASLSFTGFYNQLYDGFTNESFFDITNVPTININRNVTPYTYSVTGQKQVYYLQSKQINGYESTDNGIEFSLNFNKIKPLNLTLGINGTYVVTKNSSNEKLFLTSANFNNPSNLQRRWGIFNGIAETFTLFRLGSTTSYHLKKIGLLVSLRTEHFITDKTKTSASNIYPHAYLNEELQYVEIPEVDRENTLLYGDIFNSSVIEELDFKNIPKSYHNFHLRVSKDFLNGFRFDFYVNNVFNLQPSYTNSIGEIRQINVTPISFGTKINYQF